MGCVEIEIDNVRDWGFGNQFVLEIREDNLRRIYANALYLSDADQLHREIALYKASIFFKKVSEELMKMTSKS